MIGAERERLRIGGDAPPAAPAASLGQALGASAFHPFATLVPRPVPRPDEPKRQRRDPPASGTAPTVSATRRDLSPPRRPSTRSRGLSAGRSGQGDGGREQARQGGEASREGDRRASVCGEGAAEQEQFVVAVRRLA